MDRLEAMALLVAVTEAGSLSAAGRRLDVPLATLSRKIADLESLLGTRLLLRTTRKLALTDAGVSYVAAARRILEQVEEAEQAALGEYTAPRGELVVTAPLMFGRLHVLPMVADFLAMFPEITVRLALSDRNVDLIDDRVDMAVRIGRLPDSSMVATQVGTVRMVTCASPGFLKIHGVPTSPDALAGHDCVAIEAPMPSPFWQFRHPESGAVIDVAIRPRLTVSTNDAAAHAAALGVGFTRLLHYQAIDLLRRSELQLVLEAYEPSPAPVHLVHAARGQMPLKMRRFLDFVTPRLRSTLEQVGDPGPAAR